MCVLWKDRVQEAHELPFIHSFESVLLFKFSKVSLLLLG